MEDRAPFFEMPNEAEKLAHVKPYYGNQHVPHPHNEAAEKCDASKIMNQVLRAK